MRLRRVKQPRKPRSGAHDLGDKLQEVRIGAQHREKLQRSRNLAQKFVEGRKREVRVARMSKSLEKRWRELGEILTRAGAFHGRVSPVMPALDCGDGGRGVLEAKFDERLRCCRIVRVAGENEVSASRRRQLRHAFKQGRVMLLHGLQRVPKFALEILKLA